MSEYDVVVIGAGNGGLTAAASLAQKGMKVLMLERHNVPGGCATSFMRGRFEFEVALHQLSGFGTKDKPGPLRMFLDGLGVVDQLDWVAMENLYRVVLPGELDLILSSDREKMIATLQESFPQDSQAIAEFFDLVYKFFHEIIRAFFMKDPEVSKEKYPLYFKYSLKSTQEVMDEFFTDPLLQAAISVYWCYVGLGPNQLTFSDFAALMFGYLEFKPFHLKGGSQALSNAILDQFLNHGGEVRFNCAAQRILVENGHVKGVATEDGDVIDCKYVVSNASSVETYVDLMEPSPAADQEIQKMAGSTVGPSSLTLYIGLDCSPEEVGINEATNFILTSADMNGGYERFKTLDTSDDMLLLTCYNLLDPSFAPAGCSQIVIVGLKYADPWIEVPPAEYYQIKYQAAEGFLQSAEKVFPGLREHIEEIEVATPITHMRFLGQPGGAIYGFDKFAKENSLFTNRKSPIKGLYQAGAWAGSGGFQPTLTSGGQAARAIVKDFRGVEK
ncbi:MAG TPA: NAD(P)/FAD-dependent oxidoreductase [Syntrophomonas sp.]|nr:NAD(P)/FAD-dependent oxidoreductase [Syntrophomonas sp.]HRW12091.1 NAD(P)/FAD-dependent oxidoreductase [Syntrophomonas sp.]